jgi:hypothetical protein
MRLAGNRQRPRAKAAGDAGTVDQLHALRAVTFAGTERPELVGSLEATAAMVAVGSSVAAATALVAYPIASGQALRYGLAGALLVAFARGRLPRLTGSQTVRLLALAATGLAGFNAFLIAAVREADAGSVGVIVGCVPVALAVAGPLLERRAVRPRVAAAAVVVSAGAAAVQWAFAYGPGSSSAATTRSWISRGLSWLSFAFARTVTDRRRKGTVPAAIRCAYSSELPCSVQGSSRAASKCSTVRASTENASCPSSSSGTPLT